MSELGQIIALSISFMSVKGDENTYLDIIMRIKHEDTCQTLSPPEVKKFPSNQSLPNYYYICF